MTVPYISAPAWGTRRGRVITPGSRVRGPRPSPNPVSTQRRPGRVVAAFRRVAWIDVFIQLVVGAVIVALGWAVLTGGYFQRAVDELTGLYLGDVAPTFATGVAVIPAQEFRSGFFAPHSEVPDALAPPLGYTPVKEISGLVALNARS